MLKLKKQIGKKTFANYRKDQSVALSVSYMGYLIFIIIALSNLNCSSLKVEENTQEAKELLTLNLSDEELQIIEKDTSNIIDDIISFRRANNDEPLEVLTVKNFLSVEKCRTPYDCDYLDIPNNFQAIFDFYKTLDKEKLDWLQDEENKYHRNTINHFLINNADN